MAQVSDAVLALINKAEGDLQVAVTSDATAANALVAAQTAEQAAEAAKDAALHAHATATQSALSALAALEAELQIPAGTPIPQGEGPPAPASPKDGSNPATTIRIRSWAQHPIVTRALNLGLNWSEIMSALLKGGIVALESIVEERRHQ